MILQLLPTLQLLPVSRTEDASVLSQRASSRAHGPARKFASGPDQGSRGSESRTRWSICSCSSSFLRTSSAAACIRFLSSSLCAHRASTCRMRLCTWNPVSAGKWQAVGERAARGQQRESVRTHTASCTDTFTHTLT